MTKLPYGPLQKETKGGRMFGMCYILSTISPTCCTLHQAQQGGHRGAAAPRRNFFLVCGPTHKRTHPCFVHEFAHGFLGTMVFDPWYFVDPVKETTVMF